MKEFNIQDEIKRHEVEAAEDWRWFANNMPWIEFPQGWTVSVIPAYAGAMVRFLVKIPSGAKKSVYFDAYNRLGYMEGPYWEVHPYRGDVGRCEKDDVAKLLAMIADEEPAEDNE